MGWEGWPIISTIISLLKCAYRLVRPARAEKGQTVTTSGSIQAGTVFTGPVSIQGPVTMVAPTDWANRLDESTSERVRDFLAEAMNLKAKNRYPEAIKLFYACFDVETTDSERAALHILIGNCFFGLSELGEAEGHYRQAETAAKQAKDKEGLAVALGNIGIIYRRKGELDKALDYFEQIMKIHRDMKDREGEAKDLGNIGVIYRDKGEPDKALEHLEQALKIFEEIGAKIEIQKTKQNIQLITQSKEKKGKPKS